MGGDQYPERTHPSINGNNRKPDPGLVCKPGPDPESGRAVTYFFSYQFVKTPRGQKQER